MQINNITTYIIIYLKFIEIENACNATAYAIQCGVSNLFKYPWRIRNEQNASQLQTMSKRERTVK